MFTGVINVWSERNSYPRIGLPGVNTLIVAALTLLIPEASIDRDEKKRLHRQASDFC